MPITSANENVVIISALDQFMSHPRRNQYLFRAQCVLWLMTILSLEQGLKVHIDILQSQTALHTTDTRVHPVTYTIPDDRKQHLNNFG
jgi:hypothetical protein